MTLNDFTTTLVVEASKRKVFDAVNDVRSWWSEDIEGCTNQLNDEFDYHFRDMHRCKIKIVEFVPQKKIVWLVLNSYFSFVENKDEWTGTRMIFEINTKDSGTELVFTHQGLTPHHECYKVCHDAWTGFIQSSLRNLIVTGKGEPNPKDGVNSINSDNIEKWNLPA